MKRQVHEGTKGGRESAPGRRRSRSAAAFLTALALLAGGCRPAVPASNPETVLSAPAEPEARVWPGPPQRARIRYLTAFSGPEEMRFRKSWARRTLELIVGRDQHRFVRPYGIAALKDRILAVTDPGGGCVHLFDFERQSYRNLTLDDDEGGFVSPVGVTLDEKGFIYVADSDRGVVFVLAPGGELVRTIGAGEGLRRPAGVAIHPRNGLLYVVDVLGNKVEVFERQGAKRFEFGSRGTQPGQFNFPTHIAATQAGDLVVTDSMNFRVQVFADDGTFRSSFGKAGDAAGDFSKPKGVAVDGEGHIYVVDAMFDTVQVLDGQGAPLLAFGSSGHGQGEFWLPSGIWIDEGDRIYVADSYNQRVQVFEYLR